MVKYLSIHVSRSYKIEEQRWARNLVDCIIGESGCETSQSLYVRVMPVPVFVAG